MPKRVLDVGNCTLDHGSLRQLIEGNFNAEVIRVRKPSDALGALRDDRFDLVLVNRAFAGSQTAGVDLVRRIKADAELAGVPVMLLSNYPEAQQEAVAAGAEPGFGKAELDREETRQKLARFLRS